MRILSRQVSSLEKQKMSLEEEVKAKSLKTNDTVKVRSAGYPDLTRPQLYDPAFYDKQCDEPWVPPYRKYIEIPIPTPKKKQITKVSTRNGHEEL